MELTRRRLLSVTAATAGTGVLAGCTGNGSTAGSEPDGPTAQASFFVFGDITARVAGEAAAADLLVPVGQHGHGWEPGPSVREDVRNADLLVHGMERFQPWVDDIRSDLEADGADVTAVDVTAGVDLLAAGGEHDHGEGGHEEEAGGHDHEKEDGGAAMDPHFWMDPLRVRDAVGTVREGFAGVDPDNAGTYADNAEEFGAELENLHGRIESTVADASTDVLLVAGHDSFQYLGDRYGIEVESLTNVSPDDRPTTRDIERAQEVVETHELRYICADPLGPQQAADQLVAETAAEEVLPLTAMPGLTEAWEKEGWGYVGVTENVNLPTLERALGV